MDGLRVEYNLFKQESIELKSKLHKTELNKSIQDIKNAHETELRDLRAAQDQRYNNDVATRNRTIESLEVIRTNSLKEIETLKIQLS